MKLLNENFPNVNTLILHAGVFHADDLMVAALVKNMCPHVHIMRTNMPDIEQASVEKGIMIADIGNVYDPARNLWDHHQRDLSLPPKSSAGLIWEYFGNIDEFPNLDQFIDIIDKHDNGVIRNSTCFELRNFNPFWNEDGDPDLYFFKALQIMEKLIEVYTAPSIDEEIRLSTDLSYILKKRDEDHKAAVEAAADYLLDHEDLAITYSIEDGVSYQILDLTDKFIPWQQFAKEVNLNNDHRYIIGAMFEGRNGQISASPINIYKFPKEWLDNQPSFVKFIHKGRFLASFDTKEDAIDGLKMASAE